MPVYSTKAIKWYQTNHTLFKFVCSNYPAWLKNVISTTNNTK